MSTTDKKPSEQQSYKNIWDAIDPPQRATVMEIKTKLLQKLHDRLNVPCRSVEKVAVMLNCRQDQVRFIMEGRLSKFTLEELVEIAHLAGIKAVLDTTDIDSQL